ncbi:MAG: hypothetical protein ACHQPH_20415 [Reyranellales bacterium]|jgi:hypothetical protein
MWLVDPTLPVVAGGLAAMVAWRQETRRLHRRALHEPWNADISGEDHRQGVFGRRKRRRWNRTVLSAIAGLVASGVLLQFIHIAHTQVGRGG